MKKEVTEALLKQKIRGAGSYKRQVYNLMSKNFKIKNEKKTLQKEFKLLIGL